MIFQLRREEFSATRVLFSVLFLMVSSKFVIPLYPVPITGQLMAVYFLGLVLNPRESFAAVVGYVACGICGLPVFCGGGWGSPGSGYLVGMIFAAPIIGILFRKGFSLITSCASGCLIVYLFGCAWLAKFVPLSSVFALGVAPFLVVDALKIAVVCGILCKKKAN
ncbi:MAG: biotin transporter BioY [Holosporales bacterium]|jgi:biotin transport system substrate-specific component|nr:biotin transporter BioY [Holosporales bacterium]